MAKKNPTASSTKTSKAAEAAEAHAGELVTVYHLKSHGGSFIHGEYRLDPAGHADVPREVADLWMSHKGPGGADLVSESPGGVGEPPSAEKNRLKAENEDLKSEAQKAADALAAADDRVKALEALLEQARAQNGAPPVISE